MPLLHAFFLSNSTGTVHAGHFSRKFRGQRSERFEAYAGQARVSCRVGMLRPLFRAWCRRKSARSGRASRSKANYATFLAVSPARFSGARPRNQLDSKARPSEPVPDSSDANAGPGEDTRGQRQTGSCTPDGSTSRIDHQSHQPLDWYSMAEQKSEPLTVHRLVEPTHRRY